MPIEIYERKTCRLCDSTALATALSLNPTPLEDDFFPVEKAETSKERFPLIICRCEACGHAQLSHVISADSIYDHYTYQPTSSSLLKRFHDTCVQLQNRFQWPAGSLVLDVGCYDGSLLQNYARRGYCVVGVEPSPVSTMACDQNLVVYTGYFTPKIAKKIIQRQGAASLVITHNVFANVDDVAEFTKAAKIALAHHGVWVIELTWYWGALLGNAMFDFIYHEHLSYFSVKSLQQFFDKNGMQLFDVECSMSGAGCLRLFVQRSTGLQALSSRVQAAIHDEQQNGLFELTVYTRFYEKLAQARKACVELLCSLPVSKDQIAGFGAARVSTMMLYWFDIAEFISFLVDDNPIKHNTVSPGHHLPVLPSSAINDSRIRYVLILPWRFAKNIIEKNQAFLQRGGQFIEVYPVPKVVSLESCTV